MILKLLYISIALANLVYSIEDILIKDFFENKNCNSGIVINCGRLLERQVIIKTLSNYSKTAIIVDDTQFLNGNWIINTYVNTPFGIILDIGCPGMEYILKFASKQHLLRSQYNWLMIGKEYKEFIIDGANIDSDVSMAVKTIKGYDIFQYISTANVWVQNGQWPFRLKHILTKKYISNVRNLHGRPLIISMVIVGKVKKTLEEYLQDDSDTTHDSISKDNYAILRALSSKFNFTLNILRTSTWGYQQNGSFNGMVGTLQKGLAEIGVTASYMKAERLYVTDILVPMRYQKVAIIFRHPKTTVSVKGALLTPLEFKAWYAVIICILVAIFSIKIALFGNPILNDNEDRSVCNILLFITGAVCQQGYEDLSNHYSVRTSCFTILIFSTMVYQFYSASVVSSLLKEPPKTIKTPEDFLKSSMSLRVEDLIYNKIFFRTSTSDVVKNIYKTKLDKELTQSFLPVKTGVELIRKGNMAFMMDIDNGYDLIQKTFTMREICDISEIQIGPIYHLASMIKKNSAYKKFISYGYRKLYEGGITKKVTKLWTGMQPKCLKELTQNTINVNISTVFSAFIVLILGMFLSLMLLVYELFEKKFKVKTMKRNHL